MLFALVCQAVRIVQSIDKADIFKFGIAVHLVLVGVFDVQIGDVIRQNRHLVGVQLVFLFIFQILWRNIVYNIGDKSPCPRCRVKDFHAFIV
jgi:hypothetical protein